MAAPPDVSWAKTCEDVAACLKVAHSVSGASFDGLCDTSGTRTENIEGVKPRTKAPNDSKMCGA